MGKDYRKNLVSESPERLRYLSPREQTILRMRYGVGESEKPLKAIAKLFEVSEQTIRNHEAKAIRKLEKLPKEEN